MEEYEQNENISSASRATASSSSVFHMQCIKEESTLRVSPKGAKPPPRIVFRYGRQEKEIKTFLLYRKIIKDIMGKMETRAHIRYTKLRGNKHACICMGKTKAGY